MKITIDDRIRSAAPNLVLGILTARVQVVDKNDELRAAMEQEAVRIQREFAGTSPSQLPQVQALRGLYRKLGNDPTRWRVANEALLRRIVKNKGLYFINNVVDVCNLVSITSRQSLGVFDHDRIIGDVVFRPGSPGEVYEGIGRGEIPLEGLPVLYDSVGPFGCPTSDSDRTKVTLQTQRTIVFFIACMGREHLEQDLHHATALLQQYAAATEINRSIEG